MSKEDRFGPIAFELGVIISLLLLSVLKDYNVDWLDWLQNNKDKENNGNQDKNNKNKNGNESKGNSIW